MIPNHCSRFSHAQAIRNRQTQSRNAIPNDVKEASAAYTEILKRGMRLWSISMVVASMILINRFQPNAPQTITLPLGLGTTSPGLFYTLSTLMLSILWFGRQVQYSQSTRAHKLLKAIVISHGKYEIVNGMKLSKYHDIFHGAGPAQLSPLLLSWHPQLASNKWIHWPLKLAVSIVTSGIPVAALLLGSVSVYIYYGKTEPLLFVLVMLIAFFVVICTIINFVLIEFRYFFSEERKPE